MGCGECKRMVQRHLPRLVARSYRTSCARSSLPSKRTHRRARRATIYRRPRNSSGLDLFPTAGPSMRREPGPRGHTHADIRYTHQPHRYTRDHADTLTPNTSHRVLSTGFGSRLRLAPSCLLRARGRATPATKKVVFE